MTKEYMHSHKQGHNENKMWHCIFLSGLVANGIIRCLFERWRISKLGLFWTPGLLSTLFQREPTPCRLALSYWQNCGRVYIWQFSDFLVRVPDEYSSYSPPGYMGGGMLCQVTRSLWVVPEWSPLFNVINDHSFLHIHAVSLQLKG